MNSKLCILVASVLAAVQSQSALIENFESYSVGSFTNTNWTNNAIGAWNVVQDGSNKVLQATGAGGMTILYGAEAFSGAGIGYSVDLKIKFDYGTGGYAQSSGFLFDTKGTDLSSYESRKFTLETTGQVATAWSSATGAGLTFANGTWYYLKMVRTNAMADSNRGDLEIWASTSPITGGNPGTQIFDLTGVAIPDESGHNPAISLFGLGAMSYGTDTVSFDDILVAPVPEPASAGLLLVGALALLRRRKA